MGPGLDNLLLPFAIARLPSPPHIIVARGHLADAACQPPQFPVRPMRAPKVSGAFSLPGALSVPFSIVPFPTS
jgi:hypothetical protein